MYSKPRHTPKMLDTNTLTATSLSNTQEISSVLKPLLLHVCLFVYCLSACLFVCLLICLFMLFGLLVYMVYLYTCLFKCWFVYLLVCFCACWMLIGYVYISSEIACFHIIFHCLCLSEKSE